MRIDIHDMFDGYIDNSGIDIDTETENIDMQRIKRMTMDRVNAEQKRGGLRKPVKIAIAAAVIAVLLTGAVSAAVLGIASFRSNLGETEYEWTTYEGESDSSSYDVGFEITLPAHKDVNHLIGFTADYIPDIPGPLETADYTLSGGVYHQITHDSADLKDKITIQICQPCPVERYYILMGTTEAVKEGEINGRQAQYLTVEAIPELGGEERNAIILTDEPTGAVVVIAGTFDFDELERVAEGIDVKESLEYLFMPESAESFGGIVGEFAMG